MSVEYYAYIIMREEKDVQQLKNSEVALLGLLAEKARYGYELDKVIEERGMRDWTEIAFSSIYATLRQLEKRKLVDSKTEICRNRIRRRYVITAKGRQELKNAVASLLAEPRRQPHDLDLGIANILALPSGKAKELLIKRQQFLQQQIAELKKLKQIKAPKGASYFVQALFDRPLVHMKAELNFIREFIKNMDKGGKS